MFNNLYLYDQNEQQDLYEMNINQKLAKEIEELVKSFQNIPTKDLLNFCYTLKEANKITKINRNRLSELFQTGILVGIRPGPKTLLIYKESLEWYLKKMYNYQYKKI